MDNISYQPAPTTPAYTKRSSKFPRIFLIVAVLLILAGAGYFTYLHFQGKNPITQGGTPTPTPQAMATPVPSETPTASPSGSITPQPSGTTSLKRSDLTVEVLNGSGQAGVAGSMMTYLTGLGYNKGSSGNADTYDYTGVTITIKKSKASYLDQLKADLAKKYTVTASSTTLSESSTSDAQVIVGK